jgi:hypothetical protein
MTADHPARPEKRRRVDRVIAACDLCKRRKVKCNGVREVNPKQTALISCIRRVRRMATSMRRALTRI